jgi:hypothetical protein
MKSLVGYTGFVGSNIADKANFDALFNSKNISDAFGTNPDLLVFAGIRAEKYLANNDPKKDMEIVLNAFDNIKKINPKKIVLISTIDVYKNPIDVDEDSIVDVNGLQAYGYHRFYLENMIRQLGIEALIVRLPGLFGKNIKKNFIYDIIHIIPSMLSTEKYEELIARDGLIESYYSKLDNGFYKCKELTSEERIKLKEYFSNIGFSALNFTDSRAQYQFYNLEYLWGHINIALDHKLSLLNLATEPIFISELYEYLTGKVFVNEISENIPRYDFKTKHASLFGGINGYILNKVSVMNDIRNFVRSFEEMATI